MYQVFHHKGSMGDIIYSLPTIISHGGNAILSLRKKNHYDFLYQLLVRQPYIHKVYHNIAQKDFINLDWYRPIERRARTEGKIKHLAESHLEACGRDFDLSKRWLFGTAPKNSAEIVVNRSLRYHDKEDIDWGLLHPYDVLFVGFEKEYKAFCQKASFQPNFELCRDALQMANLIEGSRLFVGNQSLGFALAEAMKHPRVLEICYKADNCRPFGQYGYTYLSVDLMERYLSD